MDIRQAVDEVRQTVHDFAKGLRARDARVSLTHMTTNMAGMTRLCTLTNALRSPIRDSKIGVWFLVHHEAEMHAISSLSELAADVGEVLTFTEPEVGKISITTFAASRQTLAMRGTKDSPMETQLVIMDLSIGLQSAETALAARSWMEFVLKDSTNENHHPIMTYALLSISTSHGPVDEAIVKPYAQAVQGWDPVIRQLSIDYPSARYTKLPTEDWPNVIKDKIVTAWRSKSMEEDEEDAQGMSYLCLMSSHQVYALADAIRKEADGIPVELCFIHPWTDKTTLTTLGQESNKLRLVYVSTEITYIPCVEDIKGIFIGHTMDHFVMDANISTVVQVCRTVSPAVMTLAETLQDGQLHPKDITIYRCMRLDDSRFVLKHPKDTRDLTYMMFKMTQITGPQDVACLNSSRSYLPTDYKQFQAEAAKRLVLLKLDEFCGPNGSNTSPELYDILRITTMARNLDDMDLATDQGNKLNVLVLLGCIKDSMSHEVRRIIIELATLIWMNPSTMFIPSRYRPANRRFILTILNKSNFLKPYLHKGQLWFALGWLWIYERLVDGKIPSSSITATFRSITNIPAMERVMRQKKVWMTAFRVQEATLSSRGDLQLSMDELLQVEASLARAFLFNTMLVIGKSHGTPPPYFGRDVVSQIILQQPAQDEKCEDMVDWKRIHNPDLNKGLFAVYSHLQRTPDEQRRFTYIPQNMTIVLNTAIQAVVSELVPVNWLQVLWPIVSVPRCLRE